MLSKRLLLKFAIAAAGFGFRSPSVLADREAAGTTGERTAARWLMPDEAGKHERTWMAFGPSTKIWGTRLVPEVRRNLALIANTISAFEPVTMLVRHAEVAIAKRLLSADVEVLSCPLDDLWIRDSGPVFVLGSGGASAAVDFNFNGWGGKQTSAQDAAIAQFVCERAGVACRRTKWVLEGGGIEVDGDGTAIISESCVLNRNRNPLGRRLGVHTALELKVSCERELHRLLGVRKVLWLPGIRDKDITDGHTDFYARFTTPGQVIAGFDPDPASFDHRVTQRHLELLRGATDARGRKFGLRVLMAPENVRPAFESPDFAAGYVGFYVCNGAVVAQEFGDAAADEAALFTLQQSFPGRRVVQLNVDGIAAGGGSVHCATQQQPVRARV